MNNIKHEKTENSQIQVIALQMQHLWMKNYSYVVLNLQKKEALIVDPAWEIRKTDKANRRTNC